MGILPIKSPGVAYPPNALGDDEATIATIGRHKPLIGKKNPQPSKYSLVLPFISVLATINDLVRIILQSLPKVI
jgi:hypothetical protein